MNEKRIAGVCAGVAHHLNIDVTLLRVLWVCLTIFGGSGFLVYVICWIVIPPDDRPVAGAQPEPQNG
jgi:phage shock protein PspC (stress-responsive transcriptional regulator)